MDFDELSRAATSPISRVKHRFYPAIMRIAVAKQSLFYIIELIKNLSASGGQTTDYNALHQQFIC